MRDCGPLIVVVVLVALWMNAAVRAARQHGVPVPWGRVVTFSGVLLGLGWLTVVLLRHR
jgi:hypothetical protein